MDKLNNIIKRAKTSRLWLCGAVTPLLLGGGGLLTSCSDMLEKDSNLVVYADHDHLNNATDTIYSVVGIMNKMQALADRTIIFGEVRGDLVSVNNYATADLRDVANFQVGDDNKYNSPRDYYAVINNCNYFLAKADTALRNNRNELIFEHEYAAVKAYRAWTYLQLALIYGQVPFVTEPLLEMDVDESAYPKYDLSQICNYFIADLQPYVNTTMPGYGSIGNVESVLTYFPINVLLGELNLWAGNYREAALCYYRYINTRGGYYADGTRVPWPTGTYNVYWDRDNGKYDTRRDWRDSWSLPCFDKDYSESFAMDELVTMIPGDSIPTSANYSELQNLFSTTTQNQGYYSLVPSQAMQQLSASQVYCNRSTTGDVGYAPSNLPDNCGGDLRLMRAWTSNLSTGVELSGGTTAANRPETQNIVKYSGRNVHLWRRAMVYLHLAEAFNRAGLPRLAFSILSRGINNNVITEMQHEYPADSVWLKQFDFPNSSYVLRSENPNNYLSIGIHSRGSGFTEYNEFYQMPTDTTLTGQSLLNYEVEHVEDLICNEEALELAFEGQRFYDLMRVSLRRNDPSYLAQRIQAARPTVGVNLADKQNWYVSWRGKIGVR